MQSLLSSRGSRKRVAFITGDNLLPVIHSLDIDPLTRSTGSFTTWKETYPEIIQANAYTGCWGIVQALKASADIVICGRCTDASPVIASPILRPPLSACTLTTITQIMGAVAWWHRWGFNDIDRLAGALTAGHLIECGCYSVR